MRQIFLTLRFVMLIASGGSLLGALLMFWLGCAKIIQATMHAVFLDHVGGAAVITSLMGATDAFLFGVVLMVFAYAITFGFVFEVSGKVAGHLPKWMQIESIGELKKLLVQVILVYLVVDFATDVVVATDHLSWNALVLPLAILAIAAALKLLHDDTQR